MAWWIECGRIGKPPVLHFSKWQWCTEASCTNTLTHTNTHSHTHTRLSANSSYFSPNTAVLSDGAITMVIRKMWSEQRGFERLSRLRTSADVFSFYTAACTISNSSLSNKHRPHKPKVLPLRHYINTPSSHTVGTPRTLSRCTHTHLGPPMFLPWHEHTSPPKSTHSRSRAHAHRRALTCVHTLT